VYDDASGTWYVLSVDGETLVWGQQWRSDEPASVRQSRMAVGWRVLGKTSVSGCPGTTLEIKENGYTFLAPRFRLDIPRKAFSPLSKALAAELNRRRVAFDVLPTAGPPMLKWTEAPENEAPEREDGAPGAEKETGAENPRGFLKRLLN